MEQYKSLGQIIKDFRRFEGISQSDLAARLDIDIRSIIRWEKNETLVKPEKEKLLVKVTFIPYQVIRNLNTTRPIATFYDFTLRKYSLTTISNELPEAEWVGSKIDIPTIRLKHINSNEDIDNILRYTELQHYPDKNTNRDLLKTAAEMLPELNVIIFDEDGNYSGHCACLPLSKKTYEKLRNQTIKEKDISTADLVNYKSQEYPIFFCHSITADCNENFFFILGALLKFHRDQAPKNSLYAVISSRYDSHEIIDQLHIDQIWEDKAAKERFNMLDVPRLVEGNFDEFFDDLND